MTFLKKRLNNVCALKLALVNINSGNKRHSGEKYESVMSNRREVENNAKRAEQGAGDKKR